uniref:F-box domain-containing protein n=1 Tax=Ananas comosus var. bracteatus TaxID=296719 RepID=A0A6V7NMR9_ANACO|nr:unnamed protein product [Ananas comosus var. bracteatus]
MANDDDALSSSRPWSQLPAEILAQVLPRINPNEEFTRFASVCMAWGAVAAKEPLSLPHQMPWLVLTEEDYPGEREGCDTRSFYSLSEDKIHELDLPEACRQRCVGSTDGWLVTVGEAFEGEEIHVLNPSRELDYRFRPVDACSPCRRIRISGAAASVGVSRRRRIGRRSGSARSATSRRRSSRARRGGSSRDGAAREVPETCKQAGLCEAGDAAWTILSWDWEQFKNKWGPFEDAVYYKGQFYVVNSHGTVMRCRIPPVGSNEKPAAEVIAFGPPTDEWVWGNSRYLVELRGELLQVLRRQWDSETKDGERRLLTDGFYIFRLDTDHSVWDMMYTLGDHAVFLGMSTTVAVPASDLRGCKRNCIYFTDDYVLDRWCSVLVF